MNSQTSSSLPNVSAKSNVSNKSSNFDVMEFLQENSIALVILIVVVVIGTYLYFNDDKLYEAIESVKTACGASAKSSDLTDIKSQLTSVERRQVEQSLKTAATEPVASENTEEAEPGTDNPLMNPF